VRFVPIPTAFAMRLATALGDSNITFTALFWDFLKGKGIPCQAAFDGVEAFFTDAVDMSRVDQDDFRSTSFCWAATGSQTVDIEGDRISVSISSLCR
jgi:hypothetical protein